MSANAGISLCIIAAKSLMWQPTGQQKGTEKW